MDVTIAVEAKGRTGGWDDEVTRKAKEQARSLPGVLSTSSALRVASVASFNAQWRWRRARGCPKVRLPDRKDLAWPVVRHVLAAWHRRHMQSVFEAAGGGQGLLRLAEAWHSRVMADEVVSHAFSEGFHPQHSERLAAYWAEALGGPAAYSGSYGDETSVVRVHSGNGAHAELDRRAIACFGQAMQDVGLEPGARSGRCCTTTSPGRPRRRCRATPSPPTRSPRA